MNADRSLGGVLALVLAWGTLATPARGEDSNGDESGEGADQRFLAPIFDTNWRFSLRGARLFVLNGDAGEDVPYQRVLDHGQQWGFSTHWAPFAGLSAGFSVDRTVFPARRLAAPSDAERSRAFTLRSLDLRPSLRLTPRAFLGEDGAFLPGGAVVVEPLLQVALGVGLYERERRVPPFFTKRSDALHGSFLAEASLGWEVSFSDAGFFVLAGLRSASQPRSLRHSRDRATLVPRGRRKNRFPDHMASLFQHPMLALGVSAGFSVEF